MQIGTTVVVTGGIENIGHARGRFVTEQINDGLWQITKFPEHVDRMTARVVLYLRRHGPLLIAGKNVLIHETRERLRWITPNSVHHAASCGAVSISYADGVVTMTDRGRSLFDHHERLVFSVPADMVDQVTEAVNNVLSGHHI